MYVQCRHCGAENPDWTNNRTEQIRFCVGCGAELDAPAAGAQPENVTPQRPERRRGSAPNPNFGGELAPAVTLGGSGAAYTPPPTRPSVPPTPPVPPRKTDEIYMPKPKPKKRGFGWLIGVLLGLGLLAAGYFFVHIWEPATCEDPETCKICGKTRGDVADHDLEYDDDGIRRCTMCGETVCEIEGHQWQDASCDAPKTCLVCGETEGSALEHEWIDATYDTPKTCRLCGRTEGNVKGWVGNVSGDYSDDTIALEGSYTYPLMFRDGSRTWRQMTVHFELSDVVGSPYGTWKIYVHSPTGGWTSAQSFSVSSSDENREMRIQLTFANGAAIDGVAVVCCVANNTSYDWSWSNVIYVTDGQTM